MNILALITPATSLASLVMLAAPSISSSTRTPPTASPDPEVQIDAAAGEWHEVGKTNDGCDGGNAVRIAGKEGDVLVGRNESKFIELKAFTSELTWYCDGTRERCANGVPFNAVRCERAGNVAISWVFFAR